MIYYLIKDAYNSKIKNNIIKYIKKINIALFN